MKGIKNYTAQGVVSKCVLYKLQDTFEEKDSHGFSSVEKIECRLGESIV